MFTPSTDPSPIGATEIYNNLDLLRSNFDEALQSIFLSGVHHELESTKNASAFEKQRVVDSVNGGAAKLRVTLDFLNSPGKLILAKGASDSNSQYAFLTETREREGNVVPQLVTSANSIGIGRRRIELESKIQLSPLRS